MRVSRFLNTDKLRILAKAFIESQFNYCPLVWMFHSRTANKKINRLQERTLRMVYKDKSLTYEQLLEKGQVLHNSREKICKKLAIEMYKVKHNLCPIPFVIFFR